MRRGLKLVIGTAIMSVLPSGLFAATCTTWTLGDTMTTIAPGTSASGTSSGTIPCTLGADTFNSFYVYNTTASDTDIQVVAEFSTPAVVDFDVFNIDTLTNSDVVFEVSPGQGLLTISASNGLTDIIDTVCSVVFVQGETCTGEGGMVLGSATLTGSGTQTIALATSPTGNEWVFQNVSGTAIFSDSFSSIPEPVTLPLVSVGLLGLGLIGRKYRQR